jgi:hypothetical protein
MLATAHRPFSGALGGLSFLVLAACASAPAEPPPPEIAGSYSGTVSMAGQETIFGNLRITQTASDLGLTFSFPEVGIEADGGGAVTDAGFQGEVAYVLTCPGTAAVNGRIEEDGRVLAGTIQATDCEGTMEGTFRFIRRD